jgi:ketosteroid isomerase-like protein
MTSVQNTGDANRISGCEGDDAMRRSHELLDAYTHVFQDIQDGRITSANDFLSSSDEVSVIGTDPSEWWTGRENVAPILDAQFAWFRQLAATFNTSSAEAWTDGDLGFVVDQPTVTLKDGRSVQMRATTILQKESGSWKVVHQHFSIGVPNEQVEAFQGFEEAMAKV